MKKNILIIDDDHMVLSAIEPFLEDEGFNVQTAVTLAGARENVSLRSYDAVIIDQNLPDGSGIDLIRELRATNADMAIVVITGAADVPLAVKAMQEGADNFLPKPLRLDNLLFILKKSLEVSSLRRSSDGRKRMEKRSYFDFGMSPAMKSVHEHAGLARDNDSPLLIMGETGVGKGVLARWIHENGRRGTGSFVEVNCSGLRGELLASELLGHCRGAFTSAVQDRQGLLDVADGGTLFLDEIGDMDLVVQAQFLKVIEEKSYRRLGEVKMRSSDFRLICATNKDLTEEASQGRFRKDLLYRIQVMPIVVPPLRERSEDIERLALHILANLNYFFEGIASDIVTLLKTYPWPGNVRELRNVLERAVILARGSVLTPQLFASINGPSRTALLEPVDRMNGTELEMIRTALKRTSGNVIKAAKELGMSRATLYRKIKRMHPRG
ncbi:MAG: sigma-54 dependent transcriptional regulator [Nitrospirota bacterium]